jgi:hypothetical protein
MDAAALGTFIFFASLSGLALLIWILALLCSVLSRHELISWHNLARSLEIGGLWAAAAVGVWAIISSTEDAREQRTIMSRTMVATTRPWLKPISLKVLSMLITDQHELIANIVVGYTNVGHSPALNVDIRAAASLHFAGPQTATAECNRDPPRPGRWSDQSVFAGQDDEARTDIHIKGLDTEGIKSPANFTGLLVSGCILYLLPGIEGFHHTTFVASIDRTNNRPITVNPGSMTIFAPGYIGPEEVDARLISVHMSAD